MLRRPSGGRPFERNYIEMRPILPVSDINSSGMAHMEASTYGTYPNVNPPNLPEQFTYRHTGEFCLKPLVSLERKDQFKVPAFHAVV